MDASTGCWSLRGGEEGYPRPLADLGEPAPPPLHGAGRREAVERLDPEATVTIVGARRASAYGLRVAEALGRDLALAGVTVVSGMARGIDAAAHRGALAAGGTTIAVLANGPDVVYPPLHRRLYAEILAAGAAISEYPPGTTPRSYFFPARNRIMAALGRAVVIVEASQPSGSLITAEVASRLGRTVGAVPGQVGARIAEGTNGLIKDGAHLIRDGRDVLDLLYGVECPRRHVGPALEPELREVLDAVESGATTVDRVIADASVGTREAAVALARLELLGYVAGGQLGSFTRSALEAPPPD